MHARRSIEEIPRVLSTTDARHRADAGPIGTGGPLVMVRRRHIAVGGPACAAFAAFFIAKSAPALAAGRGSAVSLEAPEPMARLHVSDIGALLGVSASGELWQKHGRKWGRLGAGLDPGAPLASGYGRVVGRSREGGLWVLEAGRSVTSRGLEIADHAGMLVLALGVIAVARAAGGRHHAVRLEPGSAGRWLETARGATTTLPDAQPVRFDADGGASDENGQVVILGGPDAARYRHGVLGDGIEATTLLHLERHSLQPLGQLDLPAPFVFEDVAPRPITWRGRRALLTVRSGPKGGQLAVVVGTGRGADKLSLAAFSEPLGTIHRWLSPITDGKQILAVHTPHLGGVLHRYRDDGHGLVGTAISGDVTNHVIHQRVIDISAWAGGVLVLPTQDRQRLRLFGAGSGARDFVRGEVHLSSRAESLHAWARDGVPGVAVLLRDGGVAWAAVTG